MFRFSARALAVASARPARALRCPLVTGGLRRQALFVPAPRLLAGEDLFPQENAFDAISYTPDDSLTAPPSTVAEKLNVRLSSGDSNVLYGQSVNVVELTIPTVGGAEVGILPGHEYSVQRMEAGIITLRTSSSVYKFVTSGGFAHVNDNGSVDINSVACFPMDAIDMHLVRSELEAYRGKLNASDPHERFFAKQAVQLYDVLLAAGSGR